jgi:phosphomannomutase
MSLIMGVSGVRGIVGQDLTPEVVMRVAAAFGTWLGGGTVLVGRDGRPSGTMLQTVATTGLTGVGCNVIDLGIVSTPGAALMIGHLQTKGGVVITASHNPSEYNGLKLITAEQSAPPPQQTQQIYQLFRQQRFAWKQTSGVGHQQSDTSTVERHVAAVAERLDVEKIRRGGYRVVLDSVNGAGCVEGRLLLERLGCQVVHLGGEPTGQFAHPPEPLEENLTGLAEAVSEHHAAIGFAQDPDADRLAIVDETGTYVGEEYTLAFSAWRMFQRHPGPVAANLSTSRMIDDLAGRFGQPCRVIRTPVGEANVVAAMRLHDCVIGGEGNGGVIWPEVVPVRDSLVAMGLVLELMATSSKPISALVNELPRYCWAKRKYQVDRAGIGAAVQAVQHAFADQRIDLSDGVRVDWPDGWVHLRASNTEPIIRLIGEARNQSVLDRLLSKVSNVAGLRAD